ncbi:MAG: MFS transporter [Candidatus Cloacimonetes bacterium]|nr:MFS transporter [Candidatus Cloacimonadota bacterium]
MKLDRLEKQTFFLLLLGAFFNGFVISSFLMYDVIAKKALHALDWQITILVMLWPVSNLFSIWWGKVLEHSRSLSKFFVLTAIIGRLPLVLMLFVTNYFQYLILLLLLFSFNALVSPAQNAIYQINFKPKNRGEVFGYIASLVTVTILCFNFLGGKLLDINENLFRHFYVVVGIFGCYSALIMATIKVKKKRYFEVKETIVLKKLFWKPVVRTIEVMKKNKNFAIFERNFFIYGVGFMVLLPAIPKYLVEILQMDYTQNFLAKGIISQIGILFLAPLAGKIFDRQHPALFTFMAFGLLGLYPGILLISSFFINSGFVNYIVYFAFLVFGIVMSAIFISWSISSIYFAGDEDVSMYQSVHVTLTGLRGLFAPFLGYLILKTLGVQAVFVCAILLFCTASFLSYRQYISKKN